MTEERKRGSSWQRWVGSRSATESAPAAPAAPAELEEPAEPQEPEVPADAQGDEDEVEVDLHWPGAEQDRGGTDAAAADDLPDEEELVDESGTPPAEHDGFDDDDGFGDDGFGEDGFDDGFGAAEMGDEDDAALSPGPLLPAMVNRIDTVHGSVSALSMRLEALINATATIRSSLSDRVDEYAAVVSRASITQAHHLDDYRRSTERTVAELRRSSAETGETLHRLGGRIEELATDLATLTDLVRSAPRPDGAETGETLHRVGGRIEELATDLATLTDLVRSAPRPDGAETGETLH
nr:hypothetical protein [Actinomycetota bacterium]